MKLLLVVLSVLVLSLAQTQTGTTTADIVFKNGNVYTANDRSPKAQAIAIKSDRIVYVGSNTGVQKFVGPYTRVVDLNGKTVMPGFTDAHQHLSGVGFREMTLKNKLGVPVLMNSCESPKGSTALCQLSSDCWLSVMIPRV